MVMTSANKYTVIGIMSGSSLDGVDLAYCEFIYERRKWKYDLINCITIPYDEYWSDMIETSPGLSKNELMKIHTEFGRYLGKITQDFYWKNNLNPDFIASHGHTVFHEPKKGFTFQLGEGQSLANESGKMVICDFRSKDIALGGQGAPLVPIGDEFLFSDFDYCLNIGGIANISYSKRNKRKAFDICPANQMINHLAQKIGMPYDDQGRVAESGKINDELLDILDSDNFYQKNPPKSLSNQYVSKLFISPLNNFPDSIENKLRTVVEHIARQIAGSIQQQKLGKLLITGGGAHNAFLVNRIRKISKHDIIIPDDSIINFKEALIFAFMGILKLRNEINCLSSVTGARKDCSGGVIFHPLKNPA